MIFVLFIFLCGKKNKWISVMLYKLIFICNKKKWLSWILYIDWTLIWMLAAKRSYKMKKIFICYHMEYGLWSTSYPILHLELFNADNSFSFIASIPSTMIHSQVEASVLLYRPLLHRSTDCINRHCSSVMINYQM